MATRQIKAHFHDGGFAPDEAIELENGSIMESNEESGSRGMG